MRVCLLACSHARSLACSLTRSFVRSLSPLRKYFATTIASPRCHTIRALRNRTRAREITRLRFRRGWFAANNIINVMPRRNIWLFSLCKFNWRFAPYFRVHTCAYHMCVCVCARSIARARRYRKRYNVYRVGYISHNTPKKAPFRRRKKIAFAKQARAIAATLQKPLRRPMWFDAMILDPDLIGKTRCLIPVAGC